MTNGQVIYHLGVHRPMYVKSVHYSMTKQFEQILGTQMPLPLPFIVYSTLKSKIIF